ncbi:MAG: serine hydrolase domain-containing protein, partial [Rhodanobacter sp.]
MAMIVRRGTRERTHARWPYLLALWLCIAVPCASAMPPAAITSSAGLSAERMQRLHDFLGHATAADGYLGAVSLMTHDGKIIDWRAYGHRDLARTKPMRKDGIFRIYSMTKTVTSVAVMMLVEEGRITLEDPLSRYLPGFDTPQVMIGGTSDAPKLRPADKPVTLHALLTHTAGYPAGLKGDEQAVKL